MTPDGAFEPSSLCLDCGTPKSECRCGGPPILVEPDREAAAIRTYLRDHPDLRKEQYETDVTDADALLGLCYPAAEAYYHLRDCEPEIYCLSWSDVHPEADGTHWYLRESAPPRRWIDISLPLRELDPPPFAAGTHRGFMTGDEPSNRAQQVLDAVRESTGATGVGDR